MITKEDFFKIDMRVGTIIKVEDNLKSKNKAYKLTIDFGSLGIKISSAQITKLYQKEDLVNKQVIAVVNLEPLKVGDVLSEVLVLGYDTSQGISLIKPEVKVENGTKIY